MELNNRNMKLLIKDIHDPIEAKKIEGIQRRAWRTDNVVPAHVFIAAGAVSGVVKGAYINGELVGFVYGFLGKFSGELCHYSHELAVLPEYQNSNIGYLLKMEQRKSCLNEGLDLIIWTYDPLQSKNAYFNINKLGVITRTYYINHYGEMDDELNRGIPSDRFMVEWWIRSGWVENGESSKIKFFEDYPYKNRVSIVLKAEKHNDIISPKPMDEASDIIGVEIPSEINHIKKLDLKTARLWRRITRKIFRRYFSRTYIVYRYLRFKHEDWKGIYLLTKNFDVNKYDEV